MYHTCHMHLIRALPIRRAFTLIEVLVVIGIIAILMAILIPALRSASMSSKMATTGSNLKQIGAAIHAYLNTYENHLPQKAWDIGGGTRVIVGALFGGKRGTLPFFGINQVGSDERPLNRFISGNLGPLDNGRDQEMTVFQSPLNIGQPDTGFGAASSLYDYLGSSYTLNDHSLDGEEFSTLVPAIGPDGRPGGRMPRIADTTKTWVVAEHPIYNYQQGGNRRQAWYNGDVRASMWFLDGHVLLGARIPEGVVNTTPDYTFLPTPDWFSGP